MGVEPTDTTTIYTLEELRSIILPLIERYSFSAPALFGSYARGNATAASDIDLLVDKGGNRYLSICGFCEDLYRASGKSVDVYDYSELAEGPFKDTVLKEAVTL